MERLFGYADSLGVQVEFCHGIDPRHPGTYCDDSKTIQVLSGMTDVKTWSTLAHELGHATFQHVQTMFDYLNARQERAADEWAAHFLIFEDAYREAEAKFGTRTDWIAQELGVLERLVIAYEGSLTKIGDALYVRPRMGDRQWARKLEAI